VIKLLTRWNPKICDINTFLQTLEKYCPDFSFEKKRGRPAKRTLKQYVELIAAKEEKSASLREAETDHSQKICGERVDHSVIHYWEKKLETIFTQLVNVLARKLTVMLFPLFCIIDATKFSNWTMHETEFHSFTLITRETVFPINIWFGSASPSLATLNVIVPGCGQLMCDRWYDDNKAMGFMFEAGYIPIVKPQKNRFSGFWRRKARKVYDAVVYQQRSRGESPFGTLTNTYGDRLVTYLPSTTRTRIAARIVSYITKLLIRAEGAFRLIRHAPPRCSGAQK